MAHRGDGLNDIFDNSVDVKKRLTTKEGTIHTTPVNNSDIVNKKYVDDFISLLTKGYIPYWNSGIFSNSNVFYDAVNGRIGIGTTNPTTALEIGTTSSTGNYVKVLGSNAENTCNVFVGARKYPRITLEDTYAGGATFSMWNLGSTVRFGTNTGTVGNSAWYVKAGDAADVIFNGNVGIGTTTPGAKLDVQGQIIGGFGAATTGGTLDWNDVSNARSGNGYTLLLGSATNGPGGAVYYHPFSFEYFSKDGTGNLAQLAIPYATSSLNNGIYIRTRYGGAWTSWTRIISEDVSGNVGIGTTDPKTRLHVIGLPVYANNAAAVTGGLTAGAFYRTGADPDPVCVVH